MLLLFFLFGLILSAEPAAKKVDDVGLWELHRGSCPMFWFSYNCRCYNYIATLMTWADAELYCVSQGANLVSIHSRNEENFVKRLIRNFDPTQGVNWIGLTDAQMDGTWLWSDGTGVDFTFWNKGEPNNYGGNEHCVNTNWGPARGWNDKVCSDSYSFVCSTPECT